MARASWRKRAGFACRRVVWTGVRTVGGTLLLCGIADAATGHGNSHGPSISDLIFPAINFLLFLLLLRWAVGGAIRDYLAQRREEIVATLQEASAAKEAAARAHAEAKAQLAQVDEEVQRLRDDLRRVAHAEREHRLEVATEVAGRIAGDARLVAEQEERAARSALREETVRAAVAETIALLRRQIKGADQDRFMDDFASEVQAQP